jgi:DNA-directed RNA polymerase subunit RPC12/RpoP
MENYNKLTINFNSMAAAEKAREIATKTLVATSFSDNHVVNPAERMAADLKVEKTHLILDGDDGYFVPEDIDTVLNTVWESIAKEMPEEVFSAEGFADGTYSTMASTAEYDGYNLKIKHSYDDFESTGYVCPHCGYHVAFLGELFKSDEIECDECGEMVRISDCEVIEAETKEIIIRIR